LGELTLDAVARALRGREPDRVPRDVRRAAVALVLREGAEGLELLFIKRAEHDRDPWSGQVGFPGGRAEPQDEDLVATAVRETLEETGLDLAREAGQLGALDEVQALARGRPLDLVIAPFVFGLRRPLEGVPNHEVVSLNWLPLSTLLDPRTRSSMPYRYGDTLLELPCLRAGGLVIWGLTFRMFESLVSLLGGTAPSPPDPPLAAPE
jgi:8-oxo-dGTP pyrophosphatase MutT (NUDIX family)